MPIFTSAATDVQKRLEGLNKRTTNAHDGEKKKKKKRNVCKIPTDML